MPKEIKRPSRKAVLVGGALTGYLASKMATDAKLDLKPVIVGITAENWKTQKAAIVEAVKAGRAGKLGADADLADLPAFLGALDEEDMTDADDEKGDDEAEKKTAAAKKKAEDEAAEKKAAEDAAKAAADAKKEGKVDKKAMDAAIDAAVSKARAEAEASTVARMQGIAQAERDVRPYVGEIVVAQDSAEGVYRLALETVGGYAADELKGVPLSGLAAMVKRMPKPGDAPRRMAQDSGAGAGAVEDFPALSRISYQG